MVNITTFTRAPKNSIKSVYTNSSGFSAVMKNINCAPENKFEAFTGGSKSRPKFTGLLMESSNRDGVVGDSYKF